MMAISTLARSMSGGTAGKARVWRLTGTSQTSGWPCSMWPRRTATACCSMPRIGENHKGVQWPLVARYRDTLAAIPHIARYLFREASTPPKRCDTFLGTQLRYLPWYLVSCMRICAIPHLAISRAITVRSPPIKNKHKIVFRYSRYKYRATCIVAGLASKGCFGRGGLGECAHTPEEAFLNIFRRISSLQHYPFAGPYVKVPKHMSSGHASRILQHSCVRARALCIRNLKRLSFTEDVSTMLSAPISRDTAILLLRYPYRAILFKGV